MKANDAAAHATLCRRHNGGKIDAKRSRAKFDIPIHHVLAVAAPRGRRHRAALETCIVARQVFFCQTGLTAQNIGVVVRIVKQGEMHHLVSQVHPSPPLQRPQKRQVAAVCKRKRRRRNVSG